MALFNSRFNFYFVIFCELLIIPYFYFKNWYKWNFGSPSRLKFVKYRESISSNSVSVCVHEWGGFDDVRTKKINKIPEFTCGLFYQLNRYKNYNGKYNMDLTVTLSDSHLLKKNIEHSKIIKVDNCGMDFSGYSNFFSVVKNHSNQYIILTNSSVNAISDDFLDDYLDFFKNDLSIGLLGISYSTKMYQSFIFNNFTPHLQSFFILTTTNVLKEIAELNSGFPGAFVDYKLQLIREGEIKLSQLALKLGYKLVTILEDGTPFYFDSSCMNDNGRSLEDCFFGDYRLFVKNPNSINKIKNL
jgi:hypothetical protein